MLLVNNSLGGGHGECTKQMRKPRQTKKMYCKPPPPNKDKNKNRKTQKAGAPPWKFSLFGENQEVESEEVQEEMLC